MTDGGRKPDRIGVDRSEGFDSNRTVTAMLGPPLSTTWVASKASVSSP